MSEAKAESSSKPTETKAERPISLSIFKDSKTRMIIGIFFATLSIICISWGLYIMLHRAAVLISPSQTFYDKPMPYIFNKEYEENLLESIKDQDIDKQKQILIVYGPQGIGKTRGLTEFTKKLNENGTLVITFDFKLLGSSATIDDLNTLLRRSLIKSFLLFEERYTKTINFQDVNALVEAYARLDPTKMERKARMQILKNQKFDQILKMLLRIVREMKTSQALSTLTLFEALEALTPVLHPIILNHNIENLLINNKNKEIHKLANEFIEVYQKFTLGHKNLTFILEVSNQNAIIDRNIPIGHDLYKLLYVSPYDKEQANNLLVKQESIFQPIEFQTIWDKVGGIGKYFAQATDLMREGYSTARVLKEFSRSSFNSITQAVFSTNTSLIDDRMNYLQQVANSNGYPISQNPCLTKYFLTSRVIGLLNLTHVEFDNKLMLHSFKPLVDAKKA